MGILKSSSSSSRITCCLVPRSHSSSSSSSLSSHRSSVAMKQQCHSRRKQRSITAAKRVRFAAPMVQPRPPGAASSSVDDRQQDDYDITTNIRHKELWWDTHSLRASRLQGKYMAQRHTLPSSDYHVAMMYLLRSYRKEHRCHDLLLQCVQTINSANVRGLEQQILPILKVYRKFSSHAVLQLQHQLRVINDDGGAKCCSYETTSKLLRYKSLQTSRASRQLAYRLAQADAIEANRIYKEDLLGYSDHRQSRQQQRMLPPPTPTTTVAEQHRQQHQQPLVLVAV